jgi:hypothetical protein
MGPETSIRNDPESVQDAELFTFLQKVRDGEYAEVNKDASQLGRLEPSIEVEFEDEEDYLYSIG